MHWIKGRDEIGGRRVSLFSPDWTKCRFYCIMGYSISAGITHDNGVD